MNKYFMNFVSIICVSLILCSCGQQKTAKYDADSLKDQKVETIKSEEISSNNINSNNISEENSKNEINEEIAEEKPKIEYECSHRYTYIKYKDDNNHDIICEKCGEVVNTVPHNYGKYIYIDQAFHGKECPDCESIGKLQEHQYDEMGYCPICKTTNVTTAFEKLSEGTYPSNYMDWENLLNGIEDEYNRKLIENLITVKIGGQQN